MGKEQKIVEAIERMSHSQVISKSLLFSDAITQEKLSKHSKYVQLEQCEKPLFMVNVRVFLWGLTTGLLVTDKNVYYQCMKIKKLFRGLTMPLSSKKRGKVALNDLNEISLGDFVMGSGTDTSYLGHRLLINGTVIGTLVLGKGLTFDSNLVENLQQLFKAMS